MSRLKKGSAAAAVAVTLIGGAEGLRQNGHMSLCEKIFVLWMLACTGDEDQAPQEVRLPPLQLPVEAHSVEFGHSEIAENEIISLLLDAL